MKLPFLMVVPIALAIFFAPPAHAQSAPQDKCTIAGTVIDAVTDQPLKGADVRLRGMPGSSAPGSQSDSQSVPHSTSASTDASGHFVFESLSPGRYLLLASHDGYVNNNRPYPELRGRFLSLAPGQHIADIVVRLLPNGSISGHIADEAGKPLRGVSVQAMKSSFLRGRRELHEMAHVPTNDTGDYRISSLAPGKYYIRAKPPSSLKAKSDKTYIPLYYPAASEQSRSVALVLRAGEDLAGINLNLAPLHTLNIRGRVINARTSLPCKEAEVTLLGDQGETTFSAGQNFSAGGQANFEFQGVPPGSYVVVAQAPSTPKEPQTIWGRTTVEVKEANIENVEVVVGPGVDVSGRIRVEGDDPVDLTREIHDHKMGGVLESQEPSALANLTPDIDSAVLNADGTFIFREVPEGNYRIRFVPVPAGFYFRSSSATDALEAGITVSRGHSPSPLELVLSPGAGRIDGTVENNEQAVPGALVVLVPDGKGRVQPNAYQVGVTDLLGRFGLRNIVPGDYTIFAWEQIDRGAYFDPEFLAQYEDRGKAVHVEEGGHLSLKLDAIPAAETVP